MLVNVRESLNEDYPMKSFELEILRYWNWTIEVQWKYNFSDNRLISLLLNNHPQ